MIPIKVKIATRKNIIMSVFYCSILLIYLLYNLKYFNMITIVYDEFGYWSTAAFFAGNDWSGIASMSPYYSYGYGLILTPLFWWFEDPIFMFKVAIILNALFVVGTFGLTYSCGKIIFPHVESNKIIFAAFVSVLYPALIMNSQFTWCECVLNFIFMMIFRLVLKMEMNPNRICAVGLASLSIYSYMIHQRNIGIMLAVVIIMIMLFIQKKIKIDQIVIFAVVFILGILLHKYLKQLVMENVWTFANDAMIEINDYKGQVDKVRGLFTFQGIKCFFAGVGGRVYYAVIGTCGMFYMGIRYILRNGILNLKEFKVLGIREYIKKAIQSYSFLYLIMAITFGIIVAVIYMLGPGRIDTLVYGRYIEHEFIPFIFIGIVSSYLDSPKIKEKLSFVFIMILLTIALYISYVRFDVSGYIFSTASALTYYYKICENYYFLFYGLAIGLSVFFIVLSIVRWKHKIAYFLSGIIIIMTFLFHAYHLRKEVEYMQNYYVETLEAKEVIKKISFSEKVFCIDGDNIEYENFWYKLGILQFLLPEYTLDIVSYDEIEKISNDSVLIVWNAAWYYEDLRDSYNVEEDILGYSILSR